MTTWVCPRSESKQTQNHCESQHFDNWRERCTPNCTPTALGVHCAPAPQLESCGAVIERCNRRKFCGDWQPTAYFHRGAGGRDALSWWP